MIEALLKILRALFVRPPGAVVAEDPSPAAPATSSRFQACLAEVLRHEGGYVDHPSDPGGATNMGITFATLADWRGTEISKQDVRNLTVAEAGEIYRARYWQPVRGDALPPGVDLAVFDYAVNSGPARAVKALQRALGVAQDGAIGPVTLDAAVKAPPATLIIEVCDARMAFLRSLSTWGMFGKGWTARVNDVRTAALGDV